MIVILMGVTGTGKTTVGHALAQATGWTFADADDFHSEANKEKMHSGIPLTDADRAPWLAALHRQIFQWTSQNQNAILACSALKESYRDTLAQGLPPNAIRWVYLTGPVDLIRQRLQARHGHYMPALLLPSQLATLEPPRDAIRIEVNQPVPTMVQEILAALQSADGGKGAMLKGPSIQKRS
jgi:gluconokinase